MSKERDDHNCRENMMLDGDCQVAHLVFNGDEVFIPGQCSICNRRLIEKYKYIDTRDAETDEIIE